MRHPSHRLATLAIAGLALAAGACTGAPTATPDASSIAPTALPTPTAGLSGSPLPTQAAGSLAAPSAPLSTPVGTTQTPWGAILNTVPDSFPVYPGAQVAGPPPEPASAAFTTSDGVDTVATWYRDALEALGFSTMSLSGPQEDGSRVLDTQGDLPECRIQTTFRPSGGSTMITVLYGAGCAGGQG